METGKCANCMVEPRYVGYRYCLGCLSVASQTLEDYEDLAVIAERNEEENFSISSSDSPEEYEDNFPSDGIHC